MTKSALVVDDSKIATLAIKKALKENGYDTIDVVHNGEEAIDKYKQSHPDLVTMDINMPKLDGINTTRQILSYNPNCSIIVITEMNLSEDQVNALDGVKEIILKPITVEKISSAISKL